MAGRFLSFFDFDSVFSLLARLAAVLLCICFHEMCHGWAAWRLGDPTAKAMGRLSMNPLRHLDFFGLLMLFTVGFGWAKPVPVDLRYFRNPKRGMALTALAGPLSNLVLAFGAMVVCALVLPLYGVADWSYYLVDFLLLLATLSIGLGLFNLIPIPPLDGAKIWFSPLPDRFYMQILRWERYGMLILVVLLWSGLFDGPLAAARSWMFDLLWTGAAWLAYGAQMLFL